MDDFMSFILMPLIRDYNSSELSSLEVALSGYEVVLY